MPNVSGPYSILPAVLAGLFGVEVLQVAYADGDQVCVIFVVCVNCLGVLCFVIYDF